jgi:CRP/FNR family transcriptional regulator, cyclic AMP receptor protein
MYRKIPLLKGVSVMAHDSSLSRRLCAAHRDTETAWRDGREGRTWDSILSHDLHTRAGDGRTTLQCGKYQTFFAQEDEANAVFYILEGWVKLTVVSSQGKEAVVSMLKRGDFFGEASLAEPRICMTTATTLGASTIVRIERATMTRILQNEPGFSELFLSHLVARNVRIQEDLVDQLVNSAEKRLARALLSLAHFEREDNSESIIPNINQETLAEMVGTTRSRVSFFMNRFKKRGFIKRNAGVHVHRSLLNVVLAP